MNLKRVYKYCLALPIVVPLICSVPLYFLGGAGGPWAIAILIVGYSVITGGIPYAIVAIGLLVWMRDKDEPAIRKALLLSPLIMLAVCLTGFTAMQIVSRPTGNISMMVKELAFASTMAGVFIPIFGYFYVGITFGLVGLVRALLMGSRVE